MVTLYEITRPITRPLGDTYRHLTGQKKVQERFALKPIDTSFLEALVSTDRTTPAQVVEQIIEAYGALSNKDPRIESISRTYENQKDYVSVKYTDGKCRAYPVTLMGGFFMIRELITMGNQCSEENDQNFLRIFHKLLTQERPSNPISPPRAA